MAATHKETIPYTNLRSRLAQLGAQFQPDRSTERAHIFWVPSVRKWAKAYRHGAQHVIIEYHDTCPCSQS